MSGTGSANKPGSFISEHPTPTGACVQVLVFIFVQTRAVWPLNHRGTSSSARIPSMQTVGPTESGLSRDIITTGFSSLLLMYPTPILDVEWAKKSSTLTRTHTHTHTHTSLVPKKKRVQRDRRVLYTVATTEQPPERVLKTGNNLAFLSVSCLQACDFTKYRWSFARGENIDALNVPSLLSLRTLSS